MQGPGVDANSSKDYEIPHGSIPNRVGLDRQAGNCYTLVLLTFSASPSLLQLFTRIGGVGTGNHARLHFFNWFVRLVVPGGSGASRSSSSRQSEAGVVTTAALLVR